MIRLAKAFTVKLWQLFLLLVVLTGILVAVARVVLPELSSYRSQAVVWVQEALGQPVRISGMSMRWRSFGPQLILQDAALLDADNSKSALQFAEIRIDFGLLDMLLTGVVAPRQITIVGAALHVKRRADGMMVVAGLGAGQATPESRERSGLVLPWRLSLRDSELFWDDQLLGIKPLRLRLTKAQFAHDGERHQIDVELDLPEGAGTVQLAVDARGGVENPDGWVARFYLSSNNLRLPALIQLHQPENYFVQQGTAGFKLWGHWQNGAIEQVQGELDLQNLQLSYQQGDQSSRSLAVERLAGHFQWRKQHQGWRLDAAEIRFQRADKPEQKSGLSVVRQNGGLRIAVEAVELADAHAVAAILPLPEIASDALAGLQPQARVTQLTVNHDAATDAPGWWVSGQFSNLQVLPWSGIPRVKNLAGQIEVSPTRGALLLDSQQAEIEFKGLFRRPMQLQQLSGLLQWEQLPDRGWRIHSDELIAQNGDIETRTRLLMDIPAVPDQSPFLDLQTDFSNGTVSSIHHYLPTGIMNEGVVNWLDRALVSGRVISGSCVVRGTLRDFPYKKQEGRFEVLFGVEDLVLDYFPDWSRLEEVSTEIRFLGDRFDAWFVDGKILNSEIQQVHGWIEQLSESTPLKLIGTIDGPLDDNLRFLRETPLAEDFAATVAGMRAEGDAQLLVDFALPLAETNPPPFRIDGRVLFKNSTLHLDDGQLSLADIQGELLFDEEGIRAKAIQAQMLNSAVQVDLGASPAMPDATRVIARAHVAMPTLAERFPGIGLDLLEGAAEWMLQLDIPNKVAQSDAAVLVSAASDLVGIAIELPAPLGKTAAESRHLQLTTSLSKQPLQPFKGRYGEIFDLSLLLDTTDASKPTVQRGELRLGGERARLPDSRGVRLHARLDAFDLTPWLERAAELDPSGVVEAPPFSSVDIAIKKLHKDELILSDVAAELKYKNGGWSGRIATDMFDGKVDIPADIQNETIVLELNKIELNFKPDNAETAEPAPQTEPAEEQMAYLDPRDFPAVRLHTDQVILNGQDLGKVTLNVHKTRNGLSLEQARMKSDRLTLVVSGQWSQEASGIPETELSFGFEAPEVGNLLADMDITHNIQGVSADFDGDLNWPGGPHRINMQSIKGEVRTKIGKGSILEVDPGIGRIFGLLNLTSFQRRLSLDFSDIYEKGFGFDRIQGDFQLLNGNATTDALQIDGPAARIVVAGRTGLVKRDLDLKITVAPQISSSVTLATALANPAAGAALFLAQNIMGDELDKITSYQYKVTGSWDKPDFSDKNSLFLAPLQDVPPTEKQPDTGR